VSGAIVALLCYAVLNVMCDCLQEIERVWFLVFRLSSVPVLLCTNKFKLNRRLQESSTTRLLRVLACLDLARWSAGKKVLCVAAPLLRLVRAEWYYYRVPSHSPSHESSIASNMSTHNTTPHHARLRAMDISTASTRFEQGSNGGPT
jgi:hypothetical protein